MKQKAPTSNVRESRAVTQVQRREDVNSELTDIPSSRGENQVNSHK